MNVAVATAQSGVSGNSSPLPIDQQIAALDIITQEVYGATNVTPNATTTFTDEQKAILIKEFIIPRVYGATSEAEAISNRELLRRARITAADKKFVKGCYFGDTGNDSNANIFAAQIRARLKCSLRATNDTNDINAAAPASFSYTINNDGKNSIALSAGFKLQRSFGPGHLTLRTEWQKNNQQKKEQDALSLGIGYEFDQVVERNTNRDTPKPKTSRGLLNDFYSIHYTLNADFTRKGIFGDAALTPCLADPALRACGRQNLKTLRLSAETSPYAPQFESSRWPKNNSENINYWVFSPSATIFYDHALNNNVELLSGDRVDGGVFGAKGKAALTISPGVLKNRWELSFSGQIIQAFDRDQLRLMDFEKSSRLFTASLEYALTKNAFVGQKESNAIIPTIGITYKNGSDSLKGRQSQDTVVISLNLKY